MVSDGNLHPAEALDAGCKGRVKTPWLVAFNHVIGHVDRGDQDEEHVRRTVAHLAAIHNAAAGHRATYPDQAESRTALPPFSTNGRGNLQTALLNPRRQGCTIGS